MPIHRADSSRDGWDSAKALNSPREVLQPALVGFYTESRTAAKTELDDKLIRVRVSRPKFRRILIESMCWSAENNSRSRKCASP